MTCPKQFGCSMPLSTIIKQCGIFSPINSLAITKTKETQKIFLNFRKNSGKPNKGFCASQFNANSVCIKAKLIPQQVARRNFPAKHV